MDDSPAPDLLDLPASAAAACAPKEVRTALLADWSLWGLTATQFLGAFNDNVFKQALLLLFVSVPLTDAAGRPAGEKDLQALGTFLFSLPFILFSGYAGYLADRYSKWWVIFCSKVAEIVIMLVGLGMFLVLARWGMSLTMAFLFSGVLFFMGAQSAFFGPSKYGILPELFRPRDLPAANGLILMTTFVAIILGSALAGGLMTAFPRQFWVIGACCVLIAVMGTLTACAIRRTPPVQPHLAFEWSMVGIGREMVALLGRDKPLHAALWVSSLFWMAAAIVQMAVNALGRVQLQRSEFDTSLLISTISLGIAAGSLVAGAASRGKFNVRVLKAGAWGMTACLAALALPGPRQGHLLGYYGSMAALMLLGGFTGMFAVPLQVFMQMRPPDAFKGRMIAAQNLLNWIGITLSAGLYFGADAVFAAARLPKCSHFAFTAVVMGLIALAYRPREVVLHNDH
jgi:acyl-[acyl-carrier-protein]-phospholipid O-acyltransferase/long-chain-fatty-acid--[acyl-carrier-protein] ligase